MTQTWHDLLFAHWPVPVEQVRRALPPGLPLDTFDGRAWIGVVPFHMHGIRLRGIPPVPGLSAFPELNVRTYVTVEGKAGIWFLSLDAGNRLAVAIARRCFHLPYYHAHMALRPAGDRVVYGSQRVHRQAPPAEFLAAYRPVGDPFHAREGTLEHWLTERYCLYTEDGRGDLYRGEIHHAPWPLQRAEAEIAKNTMAVPHRIPLPASAPVLHFARRLDVLIWRLAPVGLLT